VLLVVVVPSPLVASLNSLTPFPKPFISSGIFLPPNISNTTAAINISTGPSNPMIFKFYVMVNILFTLYALRVQCLPVQEPHAQLVFPSSGQALQSAWYFLPAQPPLMILFRQLALYHDVQ